MNIRFMTVIKRLITDNITAALARGKSVLLLGPRQTGKTTVIETAIKPDISYSFAQVATRQRYESDPALLESELTLQLDNFKKPPLVFIDEVQKVPRIMDAAQYLIDKKKAQFILTGSSARKLKQRSQINLLPGRVVTLTMTPFLYQELPAPLPDLEDILLYGNLPNIRLNRDVASREIDLQSYVSTYLEEEVRAEALVRNVGSFTRFLEIAAGEAGKQLSFTRLARDIGISDTTIASYYQILEDCLITYRIDPITASRTKRRLVKSPKYLFFDLGIRRVCANEGVQLSQRILADLFEQYVGVELIYNCLLQSVSPKVRYWRDSAGPEVDYVLEVAKQYIPVEVKWSAQPNKHDARHILKFLAEYPTLANQAYIICRTPKPYKICDAVVALPWQQIHTIVAD